MKIISWAFFHNNLHQLDYSIDTDLLEREWEHHLNLKEIIVKNFADKEDYREQIFKLYEVFPTPTILFLGDISSYSQSLQEGMLRLLEEPPHNLFCILFSQTRGELLSTISSRSLIPTLPGNRVLELLDQEKVQVVKKKLPEVSDFAKQIIKLSQSDSLEELELPDVSKVERDEIDFWLWQLQFYLEQVFLQSGNGSLAQIIEKVARSQKINRDNIQKKLALSWIKL